MIFESLTKAFDNALYNFSAANGIVMALENIDAPTSTDTPFLASFMLSGTVEEIELGVTERRNGIYQIDINYASHAGSLPLNQMADLLNAEFKRGKDIYWNDICVSIESVELSPLIVERGWATRSLSINWTADTPLL